MSSTRNQLVSLLNTKVITGGRNTTAQKVRDFENAIISSLVNLVDDANVNGGYLQINNSGYVNVSFIKAAAPSGQFLRDDGTWQTVSMVGATNGLQIIGGNIGLGGTLTQDTIITGTAYKVQFDLLNKYVNVTNEIYYTTDAGVGNTSQLYLTAAANFWYIGSNDASFTGQLTQVDYNGQYFNVNATQIMPQLTPNRALYLDASKFIKTSSVTDTELSYLSGATSNIQAQINNINAGLSWKVAVRVGTTANITLSGLQSIDGVTISVGDRVLVMNQGTASQNGIYIAASGTWSRSTDANTGGSTPGATSILAATVVIEEGAANADTIYTCSTDAPITIGVTSITFIKTSATTYSAGTNITLTSNTFSLASTITGTVTWNAVIISSVYGGTGVNNGGATLSMAGNITFAGGSYTQTFTATGNTAVTLPTSGTLATLAGTETFSNKRNTRRITSIVSNATPTINTDNCDFVAITALATNITSMTTNLSGTPNNADLLEIRINDDGNARTIAWGTSFLSTTNAILPTTTVASTTIRILLEWNSSNSKWECLSVN